MTITAEVICDSISPANIRLTTLQLRYPKFIHGEFMTHRVFSRNASSSRAIPVKRMINDLLSDPVMPVYWGSNKPGMQASDELEGNDLDTCKALWYYGMKNMIIRVESMVEKGLHKQIANRLLEPWGHINVVVTSTTWANFFSLRCHGDAQPEIRELAEKMLSVLNESVPKKLHHGEWHLPYVSEEEGKLGDAIKLSVARCARVSYLTHERKKPSIDEDLVLYDRLLNARPIHASPAEHQATPDEREVVRANAYTGMIEYKWKNVEKHGNFDGWIQYRKTLKWENNSRYIRNGYIFR